MQLAQIVLRSGASIADELAPLTDIRASLVLAFGAGQLLRATAPHLATSFPAARRVVCSTAG